jgi:YD repeat-containing protein
MVVHYTDAEGKNHKLEYWRDGNRKLRRSTDNKMDLYAFKTDNGDYQYFVINRQKAVVVKINRTNLYRLGALYDWYSLAHALKRPPENTYSIEILKRDPYRLGGYYCNWYLIKESKKSHSICWSKKLGVPLIVEDEKGKLIWKVEEVSTQPIQESVFRISNNMLQIDADEDFYPE